MMLQEDSLSALPSATIWPFHEIKQYSDILNTIGTPQIV